MRIGLTVRWTRDISQGPQPATNQSLQKNIGRPRAPNAFQDLDTETLNQAGHAPFLSPCASWAGQALASMVNVLALPALPGGA